MNINDLHGKWFRKEETSLNDVKTVLQESSPKPKKSEVLEAAVFAPTEEIRNYLTDLAVKTKLNCKNGMNEYHAAAVSGRMEDFQTAKKREADPDAQITESKRGLQYRPIHLAAHMNNCAIIEALLDAGIAVDSTATDYCKSPLMVALEHGSNEAAVLLMEKGADVNLRDAFKDAAPLFMMSNDIKAETIDFLIGKGGDVEAVDRYGFPATKSVLHNMSIAPLYHLIDAGSPVVFKNGGNLLFEVLGDFYGNFGYKEDNHDIYFGILDRLIGHKDIELNKTYKHVNYLGKAERKTTALDIALRNTSPKVIEHLIAKGAELPQNYDPQPLFDEGEWILAKSELLEKAGNPIDPVLLVPRILSGSLHDYDYEHIRMKEIFPSLIEKDGFAEIRSKEGLDMLFYYLITSVAEYDYNRPVIDIAPVERMVQSGCPVSESYPVSELGEISDINYKFQNILKRENYTAMQLVKDLANASNSDENTELFNRVLETMQNAGGETAEQADTATGIGFDWETYMTLSYSIRVDDVHYNEVVKLRHHLRKKGEVDIIPGGYVYDIEHCRDNRQTCVIGIPIQTTPSFSGPDKISRSAVKKGIDAFKNLDDTFWKGVFDILGNEVNPDDAKLYLMASGPGAVGSFLHGETGKEDDGNREGKFYIGTDIDQEPHSEGVWGTLITAIDAYEGPYEVTDEHLAIKGKLFLEASFE